jgi:tRNA U34 2-thiouridine synthase MnmA/TrmU
LIACRAICKHAGNVSSETVSLGDEYCKRVIQFMIKKAQRWRTPNQDIMCNSWVKFRCFLENIYKSGMEFNYTLLGHYVRVASKKPMMAMGHSKKRHFQAPHPIKDQSNFLWTLMQHQLLYVLVPIGAYHKNKVLELATCFSTPQWQPQSQVAGLVYLGKVRFDNFIASYLG